MRSTIRRQYYCTAGDTPYEGEPGKNFNTLLNQLRQMPMYPFKVAQDAPDYSQARQSGFCTIRQGFKLGFPCDESFLCARRENPQCKGESDGDKFHISAQEKQMPQAFQTLSGLLFSEDSPVDKWKMTDMEQAAQQSRVGLGAQFTLYIKPDQENSH